MDEDSILTVYACEKKNKSNKKDIVIQNDKGDLPQEEIENAKQSLEELINNGTADRLYAMSMAINYKGEINKLSNLINTATNKEEKLGYLRVYQFMLEKYIYSIVNGVDKENFTLKRKLFFYLKLLFNAYSFSLSYTDLTTVAERKEIISLINNHLKYFKQSAINFYLTLVDIFKNNDNDIFCQFFINVLSYYSYKGTEYYVDNEKKYAKHFLEEGLLLYKKYNIEEKIKNNLTLQAQYKPIIENFKELINIIKSEKIEKYCKSFSKGELIKEDDFKTEEEKINILDRFKDALKYLKFSDKRADKLLKAIYLANIVKIEYKIFNSTNYDSLLKNANESIELRVQVPMGCGAPDQPWFNEICNLEIEIEEKKSEYEKNPETKERENKNKEILELIDQKFNEGKINFFYYILKEYPPNELPDYLKFDNCQLLEDDYDADPKRFLKELKRLYNPLRFQNTKDKDIEKYIITEEIWTKLSNLE